MTECFWPTNYPRSRRIHHLLTTLLLYGMGYSCRRPVSPVLQGEVSSVRRQECSAVRFYRHSWVHLALVPISALFSHFPSLRLMEQMNRRL